MGLDRLEYNTSSPPSSLEKMDGNGGFFSFLDLGLWRMASWEGEKQMDLDVILFYGG